MSELEKETLITLMKEAIEEADRLFATKEQSNAYIIGMLQGTIKGVVKHLEK